MNVDEAKNSFDEVLSVFKRSSFYTKELKLRKFLAQQGIFHELHKPKRGVALVLR